MTHCNCNKPQCGCGKPILDINEMPDDIATLRFNVNGVSALYDYGNMIRQTQTDTNISADSIKRVLKYMAERHTDTISAKELGSILHLADIADVDITDVQDNSILVYKKNSDCAQGCIGLNNAWQGWNSEEHLDDTVRTIMGFTDDNAPVALQAPANTNQHYILGWNAENKVSFTQPDVVTTAPTDAGGKKWALYLDPITKEIVVVKENA